MGKLDVYDCGTVGYQEALTLQRSLQEARGAEQIPDTLLLLEHPPVITMGKSAVREHVLADDRELTEAGATIEWIERGGETTYHGSGQLVGYAIFNLYERHRSIKRFVRNMEQVFIDLLEEEYGIEAGRDPEHPGVWVGKEKITALGISIRNKVTMHGFAFNVAPELAHFDWIVPCGITDKGQTSLERLLGKKPEIEYVKKVTARKFREIYELEGSDELIAGLPALPGAGSTTR